MIIINICCSTSPRIHILHVKLYRQCIPACSTLKESNDDITCKAGADNHRFAFKLNFLSVIRIITFPTLAALFPARVDGIRMNFEQPRYATCAALNPKLIILKYSIFFARCRR